MQQRELQHNHGQCIGGHQDGDQFRHLWGFCPRQVLHQRRVKLGVDQHHQQIGHHQQQKTQIQPQHLDGGAQTQAAAALLALNQLAKTPDEGGPQQQIAAGEQQKSVLLGTDPQRHPKQGPDRRPQVEQEVTQVECQLAGLGRDKAVGHQRLAGRIDQAGREAATEHPYP